MAVFVLLAVTFAGLFGLNLYFRVKVLKSYNILSRNRVEFAISDIFSPAKMDAVVQRYPDFSRELLSFAKHLRYSVWMTSVFLVIIIVFGSVLLYNR